VIEKSDNGSNRRKTFFVLGCEMDGVYKEPKFFLKKNIRQQRNEMSVQAVGLLLTS
jgi:hypothetical protein